MVVLENIKKDEELLNYIEHFKTLYQFVTNEQNAYVDVQSIEGMIDFIHQGTKKQKKKIFKEYFEEENIQVAKKIFDILGNLKKDLIIGKKDSVVQLKKELINEGVLIFMKRYFDIFDIHLESDEQITESVSRSKEFNKLEQYHNWLNNDMSKLINEIKESEKNKVFDVQKLKIFADEFKKFLGSKLLVRMEEKDTNYIYGIPIFLSERGWEQVTHPITGNRWNFSRIKKSKKIHVGDILAVDFEEHPKGYTPLLDIYYDSAEIIPQSLEQVLSEYMDSEFIKQIKNELEIENKGNEIVSSLVTKKILDMNNSIRENLLDEFDEIRALDSEKEEWYNILKRIDKYCEKEDKEYEKGIYESFEYQPNQFIQNLQALFYHNNNQHLIYKSGIIRSFVYSLQANILTLIAGPSGTGKSSIVQAFGQAVENVEVRMIPVQSSWSDTQDLLGYFHPTDKAFVPTPFMEAVVEARQNETKLFLICLDEMNLAHIEYYFSEILSAREEDKPKLRLYSKKYMDMAKYVLKDEKSSIPEKINAKELIEQYPAEFEIPENVRFIGTLNMDHTVKPISPKVVDRSFIIEINSLKPEEKQVIKISLQELSGKIDMSYKQFKDIEPNDMLVQDITTEIQTISKLLENFPNASLNSRGEKHIKNFLSFARNKEERIELLDSLILGKILPRIEVKSEGFSETADKMKQKLEPYPQSLEKFNNMLATKHTVKFW